MVKTQSTSRELPPEVAALPLPQRLGWLDSAEAVASMSSKARSRHKRLLLGQASLHVQLLKSQIEAAKTSMLAWCCSAYWRDLCVAHLEAKAILAVSLADNKKHCERAGLYPQPGHLCCRQCHRPTPPNNISTLFSHATPEGDYVWVPGYCEDCREGMSAWEAEEELDEFADERQKLSGGSTSITHLHDHPRADRGRIRRLANQRAKKKSTS